MYRFLHSWRMRLYIFIIAILISCSTASSVKPVKLIPDPKKIEADCSIEIRKLRFGGSLANRNKDLDKPFVAGFSKTCSEIRCLPNPELSDAILDVLILTKHSSTAGTQFKSVPVLGGMVYSYTGGTLDFDWTGRVEFELYKPNGELLLKDTFELEGHDTMESQGGFYGLGVSAITGAGIMSLAYPDEDAFTTLANEFLQNTASEIAKRICSEPTANYFVEQTKARDGMDAKAYADFVSKKKRLQEERRASLDKKEDIYTNVQNNDPSMDIRSGNIMVFSIGVDTYKHFPSLKYAARDCIRFTKLMKERYQLSDEWIISLTNDDATAIKTLRFLERDAAKLLKKDDTFIFYFSGHGAPEPHAEATEEDGLKKYLLLSNSEPGALDMTAISLIDLSKVLEKLPCKKIIVFIDSCFSGTAGKEALSKLKGIRISSSTYRNFVSIPDKTCVIMAASSEDQPSMELDKFQSGVFTHWLIHGLSSDSTPLLFKPLDLFELYTYVKRQVSIDTNNAQIPIYRGVVGNNIIM